MSDRRVEELFLRYRERADVAALGAAFDAVSPELFRLARHLVHDEAEAEDAVQTAFLVAVEKPQQYDAERPFVPWLIGILVRRAHELRRERTRRPEPERLAQRAAPDPHAELEAGELRAVLERTIDELPETYEQALRPHLDEGVGASEIAKRLGISANAAGVRLHRGLKLLRAALPAGIAAAAGASGAGANTVAVRARILAAARERALLASGAPSSALVAGALATKAALVMAAAGVLLLVGWWASRPEASLENAGSQDVLARANPTERATAPPGGSQPANAEPDRAEVARARAGEPWSYLLRVVDHATSAPIPNARVGEWTRDGLQTLGTTDARGQVRFAAERSVNERVYVEADGYVPYRTPRSEAARERLWQEHCVSVDPADQRVVYAGLRLTRGALVTGRVLDEDGAPVRGARLILFDELFQYPRAVTDETLALSGADGRFQLSDRVGWTSDDRSWNYLLCAVSDEGAGFARFPVLSGKERVDGLELVVRPHVGFEVEVRTPDGEPVAEVCVRCTPRFGPWDVQRDLFDELAEAEPVPPDWHARCEQWTDAEGRARFASLPTVPATRTSVQVGNGWKPLLFYELQFRAPGWEIEPLTYALPYEGERVAHVVARPRAEVRVTGQVFDPDGRPVPGALLMTSELPDAQSDADGRFELEALPADRFPITVQAMARGFAPTCVEIAQGSGDRQVVELRLGHALRIDGRVVDEVGRPLAGLRVYGSRERLKLGGVPTDGEGRFSIDDAGAGEWCLRVRDERGTVLAEATVPGGGRDVELVAAVREPAAGRVSVRVFDARTGAAADPLEAKLRPLASSEPYSPRVERSGGRVEASELGDGRWTLAVRASDGRYGKLVFELGPDARELELELALDARVDLHGRVDFDGLRAPERVQVVLTEDLERLAGRVLPELDSRSRVLLWVQPDDTFTVGNLEPGVWRAELLGELVWSEPVHFDTRELDGRELQLRARPGGRLVVLAEGWPEARGARLWLRAPGDEWRLRGSGVQLFSGDRHELSCTAPPGALEWRVELVGAGFASLATGEGSIQLRAGEEALVRFAPPR